MLWSPSSDCLPADAWSAGESAEFDRYLQQAVGLSANLLMENAAAALATWLREMAVAEGYRRLHFLAGPGNNGADALVAARQLAGEPGLELSWTRLGDPPPADSLLADAEQVLQRLGIAQDEDLAPVGAELLVDGLFGVGLSRPLDGAWREAVLALEAAQAPILAVDCPSGLDATTGEALGACAPARWTLSFIGPKQGFYRGLGPQLCGQIRCADIGLPRAWAEAWLQEHRATGGS